LNPFNLTVGTKLATEAQLDSAMFNGGIVLHILRSGQLIDGIYIFLRRSLLQLICSLFLYFVLGGTDIRWEAGINQLGNKTGTCLTIGEEVELAITLYSSMQRVIIYHMPSNNTLTM
jgi:hypothetical protein